MHTCLLKNENAQRNFIVVNRLHMYIVNITPRILRSKLYEYYQSIEQPSYNVQLSF